MNYVNTKWGRFSAFGLKSCKRGFASKPSVLNKNPSLRTTKTVKDATRSSSAVAQKQPQQTFEHVTIQHINGTNGSVRIDKDKKKKPDLRPKQKYSALRQQLAKEKANGTPRVFFDKPVENPVYKALSKSHLRDLIKERSPHVDVEAFYATACVLPTRATSYVVDELIDWSNVPNDPIFQLTFPQPDMLDNDDLNAMIEGIRAGESRVQLRDRANDIRARMNPHPSDQKKNMPKLGEDELEGIQHKYKETMLFFPKEGQYCHAFCTYCFRWAQFTDVGSDLAFSMGDAQRLWAYMRSNKQITDILITGGDSMVLTEEQIKHYLEPVLTDPTMDHIRNIRFGTKALAYWPYRFVTDKDADALMKFIELARASGRSVNIMAHNTHPMEMNTPIVEKAIRNLQTAGATIRCQSPLIKHINDSAETWSTMWTRQTNLGCVPYYMFVERDTGPKAYFEVPLARGYEIFVEASSKVSGLAKTVRGPSMSASPGKVCVVGTPTINGEKVFALKMIQARDPELTKELFFAKYNEKACWLGDLEPALGATGFPWDIAE